jgi:hypothetical protein
MIRNLKESSTKIQNQTSYTVYDLLDQDTVDRIYDQITNPSKAKSARRFAVPDFRVTIPLESTFGKRTVQALRIRPRSGNSKFLFEGLIWTALYGSKRFTVIHWYILYHLFEKHIEKDKRTIALLKILRITTERSGQALNQKLRCVKTIVQNVLSDKELAIKYCKSLEKDLGLNLQDKKFKPEELFHVELVQILQKKPKPVSRIGVGYKDKGTLPKGPKEDTACSEDYLVKVGDYFADLLELTKEAVLFTEGYDPKKQERLLLQFQHQIKQLKL